MNKSLRLLFDIGHPAHIHLFRRFIRYLQEKTPHQVIITARDKDLNKILLNHYHFKFYLTPSFRSGILSNLSELVYRDAFLFRLHQKYRFNLAIGTSANLGHLTFLTGIKSFNFVTDDDAVIPQLSWVDYPYVTRLIHPDCVQFRNRKHKRIVHPSYHALAFLHPNHFKPDPKIPEKYGLSPYEYILIRRSALRAFHDHKFARSNPIWKQVKAHIKDFPLLISRENDPDFEISPWDMHHILAFSKCIISDSQAMTAEAAVLGVPAFIYSRLAGRLGYLRELEHTYHLIHGYHPGPDDDRFISDIGVFLERSSKDIQSEWQSRRMKMLADKVDLSEWMIDYFSRCISNL